MQAVAQQKIVEEVVRRAAKPKPPYIPQIPEPPDVRDPVCPVSVEK